DVVRESESSYIVPGSLDVDRLDDLFAVRLEETEAATVSGLLTETLGRIPTSGEVVQRDGLRFEVLESSNVRVERVRISSNGSGQSRQMRARVAVHDALFDVRHEPLSPRDCGS